MRTTALLLMNGVLKEAGILANRIVGKKKLNDDTQTEIFMELHCF